MTPVDSFRRLRAHQPVAVLAGPLWELSERAAVDLVDPGSYIEEVLR